jgi:hypothetical protein
MDPDASRTVNTTIPVINRQVERREGAPADDGGSAAIDDRLIPRLRKSWHLLRRRMGANPGQATRLVIEKAKWLHDARSPVMLGIDDLTNAWHNRQDSDAWEPGGDWGAGLWRSGSALRFLDDHLLRDFPEVRVTFFTVAGPLSAYTHHQPFSHVAPLDETDASREFFQSLAEDPRFELAYHGFNHGTPGVRTLDFIQEWRGFTSVDAAVAQTRRGLDIFARTTGRTPEGGKYGGYDYNEFAEDALNECGFLWWCRDWMPRDVADRVPDSYYEPQFFGPNLIVALPSTVHGHFWDRRQIDRLLEHRQIISIAEHIAPVRPDGLVQKPNIVDDMAELRRLYSYLKGRNVWHATGTEIASYVIARERSLLYDVTRDGFSIRYDGRVSRPALTLRIDCASIGTPATPSIDVLLPDGTTLDAGAIAIDRDGHRRLVTVPVMDGRYVIRPRLA